MAKWRVWEVNRWYGSNTTENPFLCFLDKTQSAGSLECDNNIVPWSATIACLRGGVEIQPSDRYRLDINPTLSRRVDA